MDKFKELPLLLKALSEFIDFLVNTFGVLWTLALFFTLIVLPFLWSFFQNWQKDSVWQKLLKAKDEEIQRMANELRYFRMQLFLKEGYTIDEVESLIIENNFSSPAESREALEKKKAPNQQKKRRRKNK